jgi:glutamate-1-semialdehyde 2,1-aminomutase
MTLPGLGGQFAFYFTDRDVTNFREAKRAGGGEDFFRLQHSLLERGFYFHRSPTYHNGISFSHTEEDIDHLLQALESSLKETMR